jgi:hypothetical protein
MSGPILHKIMHHPMAGKVMAGVLEDRLGGAALSPEISYLTNVTDVDNLSTYTFPGVTFGADDERRHIVVSVFTSGASVNPPTSVTIGGVSASLVERLSDGREQVGNNSTQVASQWIAAIPTGASGDIVVTLDGTSLRAHIGVFRLLTTEPRALNTSIDASNGPVTVSLPLVGSNVGLVSGGTASSSSALNVNSGDLTLDYELRIETANRVFGGRPGSGGDYELQLGAGTASFIALAAGWGP